MKLHISSSVLLFALTPIAFANYTPLESPTIPSAGKFYVGAFAGGGASNHFNGSQYATAFITEAAGGPLSINAFGQLNNKNVFFLGAQLGYLAQAIPLNSSMQWAIKPGAELEIYSMNKRSVNGEFINNTERLPEHDFIVSYPMRRTMFLANAILNFNNTRSPVNPYLGFGIGNAIVKISNASANQISPPEAGINHYNANPHDITSTFAGQLKLGFSYDLNKYFSLFADYRWLYLASTDFDFGSTVYPTHAETSSWRVKLKAQNYHLGNMGVRFNC